MSVIFFIKEYIFGEYGLKILCYYFARNLQTIYYYHSNKPLEDKVCNDLLYWLQNNLKKFLVKRDNEYTSILQKFKEVWEEIVSDAEVIPKNDLCRKSFKNLVSFDVCEKAKNVSNYCENYEYIKNELGKQNETCVGHYEYLIKNSNIYDIISKGCTVDGNNYCLNYDKCDTYNPQNLLNTEKCKRAKEFELARSQMKEKEEQYYQCGPEFQCVPKNFFSTSIDYSDYHVIPLIVLSIWSIFLTLYFLYKLTPFKSWINNFLYKKNVIRKNIHNEEFQELLESETEDDHINFNNNEYLITYNRE
ncbi:PIR Superfamily Protein [Plasmodium ovale wallikeri]|uniref:Plasmodium vivax Vir protein, putative n=2 Tax=Plasmodium ovale TaxID=36330 RepID=A0A1C3KGR0_PLAOA|nr:PIR Superfamily Protein [Plasmodium ovale wallikeri]SBT72861.1 Plasmodium vivax Vir protein, putative [Plasmodium ovale]